MCEHRLVAAEDVMKAARMRTTLLPIDAAGDDSLLRHSTRIMADPQDFTARAFGHMINDGSKPTSMNRICVKRYYEESIAKVNVQILQLMGGALTVLMAHEPIEKGQQLFYHYGHLYWIGNM